MNFETIPTNLQKEVIRSELYIFDINIIILIVGFSKFLFLSQQINKIACSCIILLTIWIFLDITKNSMILFSNTFNYLIGLVPLGLSDWVENALLVTEATDSISLSKSINPNESRSLSLSGEYTFLVDLVWFDKSLSLQPV